MHRLLVTEYLKTHTIAELEAEHGVCARPNATLDKLSLNYDQIQAISGDRLMEQCRGVVIRPHGWSVSVVKLDRFNGDLNRKDAPWRHVTFPDGIDVLAWPMERFYNDGDTAAAAIDWERARILEKLDGTMCVLYWDPLHEKWHVATRSVPEADLPVRAGDMHIGDMTFAELFWRSMSKTIFSTGDFEKAYADEQLTFAALPLLSKRVTYVFELTGPHNKVVVDYTDEHVTLLAARDLDTGLELDVRKLGAPFGAWIPVVKEWPVIDVVTLREHVHTFPGDVCEGAVVFDDEHRRKFKNKRWLMASRFKDTIGSSKRGALRMIIDGTWDDTVSEISPDVMQQFKRMAEGLRTFLGRIDANFTTWAAQAPSMPGENMRKSFALLVQQCPPGERSPAYFQLWDGKHASAVDWLRDTHAAKRLSDGLVDDLLSKISM